MLYDSFPSNEMVLGDGQCEKRSDKNIYMIDLTLKNKNNTSTGGSEKIGGIMSFSFNMQQEITAFVIPLKETEFKPAMH